MITLKNVDCFDLLSSLDSESIDAVISDIPYGIGFHSMNDPDTGWDKFEDQEYYNFLVQLFRDSYRVTTKIMFLFIALFITLSLMIFSLSSFSLRILICPLISSNSVEYMLLSIVSVI